MFKNPSFLFDIVCTVVWLLLAVRYARKGFLAASVQLGGNVFSLVGARVFSHPDRREHLCRRGR